MEKRRGKLRRRERGRCEEERSLHCLGERLGVAQGTTFLGGFPPMGHQVFIS